MSNVPGRILDVAGFDPATGWPGAPPFFGQDIVPHVYTSMGRYGLTSHDYLNADEATNHSISNAERMRADCGIMEPLEARQRATALLNWHIEPEDSTSVEQRQLVDEVTKIVLRTRRFLEIRRSLLEGIWYGRYAIAMRYGSVLVGSKRRIVGVNAEPRHGDKLVFRYDDGSHEYPAGQVGIRIGGGTLPQARLRVGSSRDQVMPGQHGNVYWLTDAERKTIIVHKHHMEDSPFEEPRFLNRIHGVGVRSKIYWTWYAMVECLQRALEYLDRSALGVEIWRYPANNAKAEARVNDAAKRHVGGGRTVVMCPVYPGEMQDAFGVEHIEPGLAGVDSLLNVIKDFFGHKIKRYICGQTLTSEAAATGLGSGVADAHLATFADIVAYDARNLEETLTEDFLRHVQLWNFPKSANIWLRFVIDTENENAQEKMQALKNAWDMGFRVKASDVADTVGISLATDKEEQLFNPQLVDSIRQSLAASENQSKEFGDSLMETYFEKVGAASD